MKPKRQIIKTRPQRPYVIARIIIALMLALAAGISAWWVLAHYHATGLGAPAPTASTRLVARIDAGRHQPGVTLRPADAASVRSPWEEAHAAGRVPPIRSTWEHVWA